MGTDSLSLCILNNLFYSQNNPCAWDTNNVSSLIFPTRYFGSGNVSLAENSVFGLGRVEGGYLLYFSLWIFQKAKEFPKPKGNDPLSQVRWRGKRRHANQSVVSIDSIAAQWLIKTGAGVMSDLCSQAALADLDSSVFMVIHTWVSKLQLFLGYIHMCFCSTLFQRTSTPFWQPGLLALGTHTLHPTLKNLGGVPLLAQNFRVSYPLNILFVFSASKC